MRQFDLVANPSPTSAAYAPFFVVLQSHYLSGFDSVIVAPLVRDARRALTVLDVAIEVDGQPLILTTAELFSLERARLGAVRGSLADHEQAIRRALDRVFTGF